MNPLSDLCVVVPLLNGATYLRRTLESLQPVVHAGGDVLVVDSGSTDGGIEICHELGMRVLDERPGNMYRAINRGIRSTNRRWCSYLNSDDLINSTVLEERLANVDGDILYGNVALIDRFGKFTRIWRSVPPWGIRWIYRSEVNAILQQGVVFSRAVFDALNGFDSSYKFCADGDFWYRAERAGFQFCRVPGRPAGFFRIHEQQISMRFREEMLQEHRAIIRHAGSGATPVRRLLAVALVQIWNIDNIARSLVSRGKHAVQDRC
jgi:glycosyltransferase involved in cell wall biosynthesis